VKSEIVLLHHEISIRFVKIKDLDAKFGFVLDMKMLFSELTPNICVKVAYIMDCFTTPMSMARN